MVKPGIIQELQARGMIQDATHLDELEKILDTKPVTFYIGFDATADSLTLGHFMTLLVMKRMQEHGHRPIALLGGGTTMIGDPSGRNDMRKVLSVSDIDAPRHGQKRPRERRGIRRRAVSFRARTALSFDEVAALQYGDVYAETPQTRLRRGAL